MKLIFSWLSICHSKFNWVLLIAIQPHGGSANFVGFLAQTCFFSTLQRFSVGFSTLWRPFKTIIILLLFLRVFKITVPLNTQLCPRPNHLSDTLGQVLDFPEEFGDYRPPSFLFTFFKASVSLAAKQLCSITGGYGVKWLTFSPQTCYCLLWANKIKKPSVLDFSLTLALARRGRC